MSDNMHVKKNQFPVQPVNPDSEIQQFLEYLWNALCEAAGDVNSEAEAAFSSVVSVIDSYGEIPHMGFVVLRHEQTGEHRLVFFDRGVSSLSDEEKYLIAMVQKPTGRLHNNRVPALTSSKTEALTRSLESVVAAGSSAMPSSVRHKPANPLLTGFLGSVWAVMSRVVDNSDPDSVKKAEALFSKIAAAYKKLEDLMMEAFMKDMTAGRMPSPKMMQHASEMIPQVDTLNVLKLMRKNSVVISIPKKEIGIDRVDII